MQLIVTSRLEIEAGIVVRSAYVVVSISDANAPPPKLIRGAGFRDAIYLHFDDTEPEGSFGRQPMTIDQAKQIWDFVWRHRQHVGAIVCHCHAGMSRSPAVAAGLAEGLGESPSAIFAEYCPNQHVLEMMRQAASL